MEGGLIATDDEELYQVMKSLRAHGWTRDLPDQNFVHNKTGDEFDDLFRFILPGYNLRPLELSGAIGIEQLKKFDEIESNRKVSKNTLEKIFVENIEGISAVKILEKSDVSWFGTPFICDNYELKSRLVEFLEENKIQTRNYFAGNILIHPGYKFLDDYTKYPEANKVLDKVFFIGASPHYNEEIFNYIESVVKKFK